MTLVARHGFTPNKDARDIQPLFRVDQADVDILPNAGSSYEAAR